MQWKINDTVICLRMKKTYTAKTPPGDFKVTTPKNPLLSKQAVTSKGIPVPYTNLQSNPYPNTQLDLFCSDNLSFQCMAPSTWLTNRCADPSTRLNHQLEKDVGCKVLHFIIQWRSRSSLVTKLYGVQTQQLLQEKEELGFQSHFSSHLWNCALVQLGNLLQPSI